MSSVRQTHGLQWGVLATLPTSTPKKMSFWTPSQSFWFESFQTRSDLTISPRPRRVDVRKQRSGKRWGTNLGRTIGDLGGGFKYVLFSPRNMRKWSNLTSKFSNGLKPPTSDVRFENAVLGRSSKEKKSMETSLPTFRGLGADRYEWVTTYKSYNFYK